MKPIFVILTLFVLSFSNAKTKLEPFKIYNSNGKAVSFQKAIKGLIIKKYIFFGEYHNNAVSHWLELELLHQLYQKRQKKLVLGAEMFEADNQFILNEYLTGLISPKNYHSEMRLWSNYNTDYKPLVEFAKTNGLKFIATNIPRRYANMVYKKGLSALNDLSELAKSYIVPLNQFSFDSTIACYSKMIEMEHGGLNMAIAQAIKDATMAYFILKNTNPQNTFFHFNGAYHSDNHEGIIHYLKKKVEAETIGSISTVTQNDIENLEEKHIGKADYIICVKSNFTNTH